MSKNKVKLKRMQGINSFIKCKNGNELKRKIIDIYAKSCEDILLYDFRFKNAYNLVSTYNSNSNLNDFIDYFMSGFLSDNLIYRKKKVKKEEGENINDEK